MVEFILRTRTDYSVRNAMWIILFFAYNGYDEDAVMAVINVAGLASKDSFRIRIESTADTYSRKWIIISLLSDSQTKVKLANRVRVSEANFTHSGWLPYNYSFMFCTQRINNYAWTLKNLLLLQHIPQYYWDNITRVYAWTLKENLQLIILGSNYKRDASCYPCHFFISKFNCKTTFNLYYWVQIRYTHLSNHILAPLHNTLIDF